MARVHKYRIQVRNRRRDYEVSVVGVYSLDDVAGDVERIDPATAERIYEQGRVGGKRTSNLLPNGRSVKIASAGGSPASGDIELPIGAFPEFKAQPGQVAGPSALLLYKLTPRPAQGFGTPEERERQRRIESAPVVGRTLSAIVETSEWRQEETAFAKSYRGTAEISEPREEASSRGAVANRQMSARGSREGEATGAARGDALRRLADMLDTGALSRESDDLVRQAQELLARAEARRPQPRR